MGFFSWWKKDKVQQESLPEEKPVVAKSYSGGLLKQKENQDKVVNFIKEHWPDKKRRCEVCGSKDFLLANHLVGIDIILDRDRCNLEYPFVLIFCKKCGNTKHFSAVTVGVMKKAGE